VPAKPTPVLRTSTGAGDAKPKTTDCVRKLTNLTLSERPIREIAVLHLLPSFDIDSRREVYLVGYEDTTSETNQSVSTLTPCPNTPFRAYSLIKSHHPSYCQAKFPKKLVFWKNTSSGNPKKTSFLEEYA
jgi:hypothetical protein